MVDIHYRILLICKEKLNLPESGYEGTVFREVRLTAKKEKAHVLSHGWILAYNEIYATENPSVCADLNEAKILQRIPGEGKVRY